MVHSVLCQNFPERSDNALLGITVAVGQTEQLNPFVGIDQTTQSNVIDGHLIGGVSVHIQRKLHLEAGGGVSTNVLHYLDVLAKELVDRHILLHYFQNAIDERNLVARTLQVPHELVEGLDCGLLLPAPPRGILDKISHHFKVQERTQRCKHMSQHNEQWRERIWRCEYMSQHNKQWHWTGFDPSWISL